MRRKTAYRIDFYRGAERLGGTPWHRKVEAAKIYATQRLRMYKATSARIIEVVSGQQVWLSAPQDSTADICNPS